MNQPPAWNGSAAGGLNAGDHHRLVHRVPRRPRIALLVSALAGLVVACGGSNANPSSTVSAKTVKSCLSSHGFRVTGGQVSTALRGQSGAIAELITPGAFIAFYPTRTAATQAQPGLLQNARRLHGSITRRHNLTILFVGSRLSAQQRQKLLACAP